MIFDRFHGYNVSMILRKIRAAIAIMRPELALSAAFCVVVGQVVTLGRLPGLGTAVAGFISGLCLSGAALIFNDLFDLEIDRINQPQRPLPSGAISPGEVIAWGIVVSLAGLVAAASLGWTAGIIGVLFWGIGIYYNWRGKQAGLAGNLMVSASVGVTFLLGAVAVGDPWNRNAWVFSAMAFFIDLGEEIAGDGMDMEGDRIKGSRSLALTIGRQPALWIAVTMWGLVILLGWLPILGGWMGWPYAVLILLTDGLILYFSRRLLKANTPAEGRKAMRGVYLGAMLILLGFIFGQFLL